jgi:hypothetical protein
LGGWGPCNRYGKRADASTFGGHPLPYGRGSLARAGSASERLRPRRDPALGPVGGGTLKAQTVALSSSSNYEAGDLRSETADLRLSSSGSAKVWVTDQLKVNTSSSGSVSYYGSPQVTQNTSGSGKAISLGPK